MIQPGCMTDALGGKTMTVVGSGGTPCLQPGWSPIGWPDLINLTIPSAPQSTRLGRSSRVPKACVVGHCRFAGRGVRRDLTRLKHWDPPQKGPKKIHTIELRLPRRNPACDSPKLCGPPGVAEISQPETEHWYSQMAHMMISAGMRWQ